MPQRGGPREDITSVILHHALLVSLSDNSNIRAAQWADHQTNKTPNFHPRHPANTPQSDPPKKSVRFNRLRTGVGRFRSCLYKWVMASSAACECGAEEQTVDHVVLQYPIHRPPYGLHGLTVLDDETIEWLLNICSEI